MPVSRAAPVHDAAALAILQQAYDDACGEIGVAPHPSGPSDEQETRETVAAAIMDLAATGLRDPHVLRERALQELPPQTGRRAIKRLIEFGKRRRARGEGSPGGTPGPRAIKT